jgi:hypothetical protein
MRPIGRIFFVGGASPEGFFCRSELAREKLQGAAFILISRVIVGDFREQELAARLAPTMDHFASGLAPPTSGFVVQG